MIVRKGVSTIVGVLSAAMDMLSTIVDSVPISTCYIYDHQTNYLYQKIVDFQSWTCL